MSGDKLDEIEMIAVKAINDRNLLREALKRIIAESSKLSDPVTVIVTVAEHALDQTK